mgnify:CR=1 FL=1
MNEMGTEMKTEITQIDGVVIGRLAGLNKSGSGRVEFEGSLSAKPITARSLVPLGKEQVGREVALQFEEGNPAKPIIMGFLYRPESTQAVQKPVSVEIDGEALRFKADKEIILQCGKASLTLTRAGKILLRGTYVVSRSSGANKIKGGSVEIN